MQTLSYILHISPIYHRKAMMLILEGGGVPTHVYEWLGWLDFIAFLNFSQCLFFLQRLPFWAIWVVCERPIDYRRIYIYTHTYSISYILPRLPHTALWVVNTIYAYVIWAFFVVISTHDMTLLTVKLSIPHVLWVLVFMSRVHKSLMGIWITD